ncbi:O-linked N-acetylglucosamine transferase, SPINDLY family protein [Phaeobacter italicus]|uniref:O-linked N-acetylglucosamine transferase, SPINDLY family protein n=1 Tax=Phaeobacter italicus TaxID=481446 RepID=UPI000669F0AA|nr:UDP-N-acetylglucosamine-peptide N-acetylglucosaminyltransferase [Phaeobacter italicus]CRL14271.1 putative O-linked N-acetylglucosamine transferase, SPINDLY family [Phaeobacter italicus]SFG23409.1 Predicted O-linked N-acetylglucosamine transferase, SPINDLY family [Phaeobacter italicus]
MTVAFPNGVNCPLYTHAVAMMRSAEFPSAEALMRQSLQSEGETAISYHYLAEIVASDPARIREAIGWQQKALSLAPHNSVFIAALGSRLRDGGLEKEALEVLEYALEVDENNAIALPLILRLRRQFLAWTDAEQETATLQRQLSHQHKFASLTLLTLIDDPELQLANARLAAPVSRQIDLRPHPPSDRIRVGYFSADIYDHPTMHLFEGALRAHDRDRFEFFVYDLAPREGGYQQLVQEIADTYRDISAISAGQIAEVARRDQIDIAVDLKGDTFQSRPEIFAHRAAPVQVSFLGFPGTSGMADMDFMVADPITIPPEAEHCYSERILRMPQCYQPNTNPRYSPADTNMRDRFGIPQDRFVFATFNNIYKIGPREFATWMEILKAAPNSVLLFYLSNLDLKDRLIAKVKAAGVAPDRVILTGPLPQKDHLDRISQVDLCLDCFSYNAHTTASDAIWCGVPILTLCGEQFAARVATSILHAANLAELSVTSVAEYVQLAAALAKDPERLSRIKRQLKEERDQLPLFDTQTWTRDFEGLLEAVYQESRA